MEKIVLLILFLKLIFGFVKCLKLLLNMNEFFFVINYYGGKYIKICCVLF